MTAAPRANWTTANQRYLMARVAVVRTSLAVELARVRGEAQSPEPRAPEPGASEQVAAARKEVEEAGLALEAPSALDQVCAAFGLSPFERDVLLLCAGVELDSDFAALCGAVQGESTARAPTFSVALAALAEPHWSALTPAGPLRYWRLLEVGSGIALTSSPLRIDERVLHHLTGVCHLDDRLRGIVRHVAQAHRITRSHEAVASQIRVALDRPAVDEPGSVIELAGDDSAGKRAVAAYCCRADARSLYHIRAADVPVGAAEREEIARLLQREMALSRVALLLELEDETHEQALAALLDSVRGAVFVATDRAVRVRGCEVLRFDIDKPTASEQHEIWTALLGPQATGLNGELEQITGHFRLSLPKIHAASTQLDVFASESSAAPESLLWEACRRQARPAMAGLAKRVDPVARWDDLVLPCPQREALRDLVGQVRQRSRVYEQWGFAGRGNRGLGITVLFAGDSGTGKTLAAEVLANELNLDLYVIDLSGVVSKYIGETEKNLRRVFEAAEEGGAVLLFDEADALFGKRSEVRDSHDRYANIEVSYLLQQMEAYRGLAILTTNMKRALDAAFLRRIRLVVDFPFPHHELRAAIWNRVFPPETPTEGLHSDELARLNIAGGNIRNIALIAAFLAADEDEPVRMSHLLRAARTEYMKLERKLTATESEGWS